MAVESLHKRGGHTAAPVPVESDQHTGGPAQHTRSQTRGTAVPSGGTPGQRALEVAPLRPMPMQASPDVPSARQPPSRHRHSALVDAVQVPLPQALLEHPQFASANRALPSASLWPPLLVWLACIGYGTYLHNDPPKDWRLIKDKLPLMWFDRFLRQAGSLLPLPVLVVRAASNFTGHVRGAVRKYHHFLEAMLVYGGLTLVRVLVYITHRDGWFGWLLNFGVVSATPVELMSDHVFLASCLAAIFSSEAVLLAVDLFRHPHSHVRRFFLGIGMLLCSGLYLLTCGDMFYTTFYFHSRAESGWAAITGLLTFQLPIAWWLLYGVRARANNRHQPLRS
eukprot:jgi/Botrbrau1/8276/Bobra.0251s0005.1